MAKSKSSASTTTTTTTTAEPKEDNVVVKYIKETRSELRKVTWPTQDEAKNLTLIIVAVSMAMALFLGTFDYVFQTIVAGIVASDMIYIGLAVVLFLAGAAGFYFNNQQE